MSGLISKTLNWIILHLNQIVVAQVNLRTIKVCLEYILDILQIRQKCFDKCEIKYYYFYGFKLIPIKQETQIKRTINRIVNFAYLYSMRIPAKPSLKSNTSTKQQTADERSGMRNQSLFGAS